MWVQSLDREDPLEMGMATHSRILAWRIPWTEEPLQPTGHKESDTTERLTLSHDRLAKTMTAEYLPAINWMEFIISVIGMEALMGRGSTLRLQESTVRFYSVFPGLGTG